MKPGCRHLPIRLTGLVLALCACAKATTTPPQVTQTPKPTATFAIAASPSVAPIGKETSVVPTATAPQVAKPPMSFDECVIQGYPVSETVPPRCATPDGSSFAEGVVLELVADKTYSWSGWEYGDGLLPSMDGGYLVTGIDTYGRGCFLLKVDSLQQVQWRITVDEDREAKGEFTRTWCEDFAQAQDGGYVVAMQVNETDAMAQPIDRGILIEKRDQDGKSAWQKVYEQSWEDKYAGARRFASEPGFLLTGVGFGPDGIDVIKIDDHGKILGMQDYGFERAVSALALPEGGYVVLGDDEDARGGDEINARLVRADASGRTVWETLFLVDRSLFESQGTQRHTYGSEGRVLAQTGDGGFLVAGYLSQRAPDPKYKFWQVKLDGEGVVEWEKTSDVALAGLEVVRTLDGGYLTAATCLSGGCPNCFPCEGGTAVMKLDEEGSLEWQNVFQGGEDATLRAVGQGSDGLYAAVGMAEPRGGGGDMELWLVVLGERNPR